MNEEGKRPSAEQGVEARDALVSSFPSMETIDAEWLRLKKRRSWRRAIIRSFGSLLVVAAIAVLISLLYLPTLRCIGSSMEPNIMNGDIIVGVKNFEFENGQICSFYYNNKILLKRVIATAGQQVDMDENGFVYVNGVLLDEPYVTDRCAGITDIEFPVNVPENSLFVMGDHRETSVDSRSSIVGFVSTDQIVGKMLFRVWPLPFFGSIE